MRWLLYLYPRTWRGRYEAEFMALLEERGLTLPDVLDIVLGALDAHLQRWRSTLWTMREARPRVKDFHLTETGPAMLAAATIVIAIAAILYSVPGSLGSTANFWTALATGIGLGVAMVHITLGLAAIRLLKDIRDTL